jgi:hypothetical protein
MAETTTSKDEEILATAKERFEQAISRESHNRERQMEDIRFAASSPDDPWQWDEKTIQDRKLSMRPMLTINKMPQHIRQVTNDIRQNRPSIRYRPADDKADPEVADILMGLVRHIEAHSDADIAYDTAAEHQVTSGLGYIRVMADYVNDDSFDQDIFIKRVKNPFRVHMDPDIQDPAGGDAKWCFIDEDLTDEEFKAQYPDADPIDWKFADDSSWFSSDKKVRIAEYFEIVEKEATLCLYANGMSSFKGEDLPEGVFIGERPIKERKTVKKTCVWRKINGQQILEGGEKGKEFPSRFIPVARVVGNEWEVEGKVYVSGIVRNAKDSQRMYNVAQTAIVERVMLSPKTPWTAPVEAVEGYEKQWQTANTANHSYLPYNHVDAEGNPIPSPTRVQAAQVETGLNQIAMGASDDIKAETGQYDASLGQKSNETSGRAIMARQREGDNATYHYVDNLGRAIRHIGRVILDMIPAIYDTQRVARILGEDGEVANAIVDPQAPEAFQKVRDEQGEIKRIFNPNIGFYDVYTTSGPSFTTRRIEAVEAMTAMTQANPELWQVIGDQLVKNMDWPGAEEMAERLKLTLLPQVQQSLDKDEEQQVPPQIQQAMQQMEQQVQALQSAGQEVQGMLTEAQQKLQAETVARQKAEMKAQQADMRAQQSDMMLKIAAREEQAMNAVRQAQEGQEPKESAPAQPQQAQQPMVLPDVNGQLAGMMAPIAEVMQASQQGTQEALSVIAEQQANLGVLVQESSAQTAQLLATVVAEIAKPKTTTMQIKSPSGGVYTATKTEA